MAIILPNLSIFIQMLGLLPTDRKALTELSATIQLIKNFFFHRGTFICIKTWKSITNKAKLDKKQLFTKEFLTRCYFQQSNNIEINYL